MYIKTIVTSEYPGIDVYFSRSRNNVIAGNYSDVVNPKALVIEALQNIAIQPHPLNDFAFECRKEVEYAIKTITESNMSTVAEHFIHERIEIYVRNALLLTLDIMSQDPPHCKSGIYHYSRKRKQFHGSNVYAEGTN